MQINQHDFDRWYFLLLNQRLGLSLRFEGLYKMCTYDLIMLMLTLKPDNDRWYN